MPVGDQAGWKQIFTDDFTTPVPRGSFPRTVSNKWSAYPYPWQGRPTWATYDPARTTSFHDGMMDIWIHTEGGERLIAANEPRINGPPPADLSQLYGRYAIRARADSFGYYKASWLLWPKSGVWPRDGEIDFPEGGFDGTVAAFMHRQDGTWVGDADAFVTTETFGRWHTYVIEWLPDRVTFSIDGRVIGESTSRIPNTPMRYVIQNGGRFDTGVAPNDVQGHVYIDWIAVYKPASKRFVEGTPANDVLVGTARADVFYARGGNDIVRGLGGRDVIHAGAGNDVIGAGAGNDVVYGGTGRDTLRGGAGRDVIYARDRARDRVYGGLGGDRARVDRLRDRVRSIERFL